MKTKPKFSDGLKCDDISSNNYMEFGKFMINTKFLNDNILLIKYKSYAPIPELKRKSISELLKSIFQELLITKELNYGLLSDLEDDEKALFKLILKKAGLMTSLNYNENLMTDSVSKLIEKYNIHKGQIIAGNNNSEIIKDIEDILFKLVKVKRITQNKADEILELIKDL